ncbi:hypothetical protein SAMN06295885_0103 [Rathayibacter oskolensis]|uniref:DUF2306 domain-containing protein n=1 Tax=Rathayibacter oskolensis TaxID=1891671 RepID=A0A1X7MTM8_9MICO|nr:hypothetical protein [Rathayibacter oskolensis]SMH28181.1 hypothetical protein SAMN06295885_0103 [Rathayibacter oskolensis]
MYATAIAIHATAGTAGFVLGLLLACRPGLAGRRRPVVRVYVGLIVVLVAGLAAAVIADWSGMEASRRLVDVGLILLGLYTLHRAVRALRVSRAAGGEWRPAFVDHVGFTLISLFDGFVIVAALNLGAPTPLVLLIAALGVVGGIAGVHRLRVRAETEAGARRASDPDRV